MTYRQLLDAAYRFAGALSGLGVRKGDRVAVMLPNCPQAMIAYYGTLMIGGIVVMTNPLYMPRELEHQLNDAGAATIVTLDLLFERVMKVVPQTGIKQVIVTSIKDYLPFPKNWLYPLKAKKRRPETRGCVWRRRCIVGGPAASRHARTRRRSGRFGERFGADSIYRRHDRNCEGRHADPLQFDRECHSV